MYKDFGLRLSTPNSTPFIKPIAPQPIRFTINTPRTKIRIIKILYDRLDRFGHCIASYEDIASDVGASPDHVGYLIREMQQEGIVQIISRGFQKKNEIRFKEGINTHIMRAHIASLERFHRRQYAPLPRPQKPKKIKQKKIQSEYHVHTNFPPSIYIKQYAYTYTPPTVLQKIAVVQGTMRSVLWLNKKRQNNMTESSVYDRYEDVSKTIKGIKPYIINLTVAGQVELSKFSDDAISDAVQALTRYMQEKPVLEPFKFIAKVAADYHRKHHIAFNLTKRDRLREIFNTNERQPMFDPLEINNNSSILGKPKAKNPTPTPPLRTKPVEGDIMTAEKREKMLENLLSFMSRREAEEIINNTYRNMS